MINNNIELYSRNTSIEAVFAERVTRIIRDPLERPVFERNDAIWFDILHTKTKQNTKIHTSIKLTPIEASFEKNEGFVCKILLDKRNKIKPKFQLNNIIRLADLRKTISKKHT